MAEVKYVKLKIDIFEDEKIDYIMNLENGDAVFLIWFQLFLKVKRKGTDVHSTFSDMDEPIHKILAIILDEPEETVIYAIEELTKLEMVEINGNEVKIIVPWLSNQHYRTTSDYINWRTAVFEKDSYTCQHCKIRGRGLNAHHIMSFADHKNLRYEVSNGITLCEECHKSEHKRLRELKNHGRSEVDQDLYGYGEQ